MAHGVVDQLVAVDVPFFRAFRAHAVHRERLRETDIMGDARGENLARGHGAKEAPGYEILTGAIKAGSRLAIWLSERF